MRRHRACARRWSAALATRDQHLEMIAAAAWRRTWIMNEQPQIDPFGGQPEMMCYRDPQPYRCRIAKT